MRRREEDDDGGEIDVDCTTEGNSHVPLSTTVAFTATRDSVGEPAYAIKVFEKSKAEVKEGQKSHSITLDDVEIDLPDKEQSPEALVNFLVSKINDEGKPEDFRNNVAAKTYNEMPYKADREKTADECKVDTKKWKKGSACLVLTRVLWGGAGNGPISYKENYTKSSD